MIDLQSSEEMIRRAILKAQREISKPRRSEPPRLLLCFERLGIGVTLLAENLDLTAATVSEWRHGKRPIPDVHRVAMLGWLVAILPITEAAVRAHWEDDPDARAYWAPLLKHVRANIEAELRERPDLAALVSDSAASLAQMFAETDVHALIASTVPDAKPATESGEPPLLATAEAVPANGNQGAHSRESAPQFLQEET